MLAPGTGSWQTDGQKYDS